MALSQQSMTSLHFTLGHPTLKSNFKPIGHHPLGTFVPQSINPSLGKGDRQPVTRHDDVTQEGTNKFNQSQCSTVACDKFWQSSNTGMRMKDSPIS